MKRISALMVSLLFLALDAQASETRLWIVKPAPAGDLADCPKRAEDAVKNKSPDARLLTMDAVIMLPNEGIPLLGEGGPDEKFHELADRCFALTVDGKTVISGATLWPHSARLLRFPVLQVLTSKQGEALRFRLTPAFPEEHSTINPEKWGDKVWKLRGSALEKDYKVGALSRLARYIGTYRYDEILNDPDVDATLNSLMNTKEKSVLLENLKVMAPVAFSGTHMILSGNKPHGGGTDEAILAIRLVDGTIHAAVRHNNKVFRYADKRDAEEVPAPVQKFIDDAERFVKARSEKK